jgi:hypothetical protein
MVFQEAHMGEINWSVTLLLGLFLGIPFSVLANLLTPRFQRWLDRQALSSKGKQLDSIQSEYGRIKSYADDTETFKLKVMGKLCRMIGISTAGLGITAFAIFILRIPVLIGEESSFITFIRTLGSTVCFMVGAIPIMIAFSDLWDLGNDVAKVVDFPKYEKQMLTKLEALAKEAKHSSATGEHL